MCHDITNSIKSPQALNDNRDGLFSDSDILAHFGKEHVKGVNGCQDVLDKTCEKLLSLADEIEGYKRAESGLSEKGEFR